uniref:Uncharacterized protein n=1 Tax=Anguilla anguilla TaxID=7936 RepID=A0A0E9UYY7_ANGAN
MRITTLYIIEGKTAKTDIQLSFFER